MAGVLEIFYYHICFYLYGLSSIDLFSRDFSALAVEKIDQHYNSSNQSHRTNHYSDNHLSWKLPLWIVRLLPLLIVRLILWIYSASITRQRISWRTARTDRQWRTWVTLSRTNFTLCSIQIVALRAAVAGGRRVALIAAWYSLAAKIALMCSIIALV